jgi:hypothetical protein
MRVQTSGKYFTEVPNQSVRGICKCDFSQQMSLGEKFQVKLSKPEGVKLYTDCFFRVPFIFVSDVLSSKFYFPRKTAGPTGKIPMSEHGSEC